MAEGNISFYKIGFRALFDEQQIEAFLQRCVRPAREKRTHDRAA
jgi:hypothetical protein